MAEQQVRKQVLIWWSEGSQQETGFPRDPGGKGGMQFSIGVAGQGSLTQAQISSSTQFARHRRKGRTGEQDHEELASPCPWHLASAARLKQSSEFSRQLGTHIVHLPFRDRLSQNLDYRAGMKHRVRQISAFPQTDAPKKFV